MTIEGYFIKIYLRMRAIPRIVSYKPDSGICPSRFISFSVDCEATMSTKKFRDMPIECCTVLQVGSQPELV